MTANSPRPTLRYASAYDRSGYAVAARRYLRALAVVDVPAGWAPLKNTPNGYTPVPRTDEIPTELRSLPDDAADDAVLMMHCIPHSWHRVRSAFPSTCCIGQTVWESDPIPRRWHHELAAADELWVPTQWNADVFSASGITAPIHVVPHPIETTAPSQSPVPADTSQFTFLSVSTWDWRKRPDLLLHAFLKAFTAADPVRLVLKTDAQILSWRCAAEVELNTWWQVMQIVRQYPNAAEVVLVTQPCDDAEMAALIRSANCYVSTTCAEGWGLGAFDAAVAGIPVVITGHGGHVEWLGADHPGLIPFQLVDADHPDASMFEPGMKWALADVDATGELMRSVVQGASAIAAAAPSVANRLRRDYSEQAIGARMRTLLA